MSRTTKNPRAAKGESPKEGKSRGKSFAQRARSFKEDFLEIISHMRSPGASGGLPESPSTPAIKDKTSDTVEFTEEENLSKDLEYNVRQARYALSHFRSVISKNHLEMIPGNGTVVLETVTAIQTLLNKHVINDVSSTLVLASNKVHESVAKLLKFCDDYLLIGEKVLVQENISDIVAEVGFNIEKWVSLIKVELGIQGQGEDEKGELPTLRVSRRPRTLSDRSTVGFRQGSLPNISHTSSGRETPEKTTVVIIETPPESSENVPSDSPPPKPPLPDRFNLSKTVPPPLPPKKRQLDSAVKSTPDRSSVESKSPEGSSSFLTISAGSMDSVLNQSRVDEDEVRQLVEPADDVTQVDEGISASFSRQDDRRPTFYWDNSGVVSTEKMRLFAPSAGFPDMVDSPSLGPDNSFAKLLDRLSGSQAESGFGSIPSRRSSSQSYSASSQRLSSTRSSQQSYSSQESYQTEKRVLSPDASSCSKVPSVVSESDPTVLSASSSFEKLSLQKQAYSKMTAELSSSEFGSSACSTGEQSVMTQVSHEEIKMEESHFRSSSPSSPTTPPQYLSMSRASVMTSPEEDKPPALPEKKRSKSFLRRRLSSQFETERTTFQTEDSSESTYIFSHIQTEDGESIVIETQKISTKYTLAIEDNSVAGVAQSDTGDESTTESQTSVFSRESKDQGVQTEDEDMLQSGSSGSLNAAPPPLPPKKRPIMAYMEMFGNASHSSSDEFLRHSIHAYKMLQQEWMEEQRLLSNTSSCCFNLPTDSNPSTPVRKPVAKLSKPSVPPALPPKKSKSQPSTSFAALMPEPVDDDSVEWEATSRKEKEFGVHAFSELAREPMSAKATSYLENPLGRHQERKSSEVLENEVPLIESLDVAPHIQFKTVVRGVFVVKGGPVDALIAHAANSHENDYMYEEAFIITYRTFITPFDLFQKLVHRYDKLCASQCEDEQKAARDTFDFIVRTAGSLTLLDLNQDLLRTLMGLVHRVVRRGDLSMGASLRNIIIQRCELKKLYNTIKSIVTPCSPSTRISLFDFKSEQIAEQMTMMDAELFLRIDSAEVLTWAEDQSEELSPNLSRFTVHFNKMSYWTRSRILEQRDPRTRGKYLLKFVKIMKHLRKINNFNSCLAILSALDSAPVRRLDWQKHIMEGIQEHSDLIDSSSSFRAYRLALADSQPPCIPYIGLVLQDLTFINAGNPNLLPDGSINFSKRWQQYDVIQNMARFKIGLYNYRKNDKIIKFFNEFDDALSEEEMWQLSEKLKPRPSKGK